MKFSWVPFQDQIGKLLKTILPKGMIVPILQGKLRGKKWIIGSGNVECALGSYEHEKRILFEKEVSKSSVVYDIGAHVGFYTLLASELVGESGKVIAFEPVPRNLNYLKRHLEINNCNDNVMVIEAAVSDKCGISHFNEGPNSSVGHLSEDDSNLIVDTVNIDELVGNSKIPAPDYIKIDVEGAELLVLKGAKSTLNTYSPKIFLATHSHRVPNVHIDCCNFLVPLGYKLEPILGNDLYNTKEIFAYKNDDCKIRGTKGLEDTMKKYKVALITNISSPYRIPLFEKIAEHPSIDLCVYFSAVTEKNREWAVELSDKFKYKILPGFAFKYQGKDLISYHVNPSIIQELNRNNYDVIIGGGHTLFTTQVSFILSKIRNTPFILWTGGVIKEEPNLLEKLSLLLAKFIVKHSDAFIAYGTRAKEYLVSLGASPEKVFIAYNTVDTDFFKQRCSQLKAKKEELKDKMGIKNKIIVLYVGRLIEQKDVKTLIKAYSKLKDKLDVALLIVGDGMQKNELKNLCIKNKINDVYFVGFKQKEELPQYYAISDLFVLPSTQEIWGLVLNEAMACGLPVITTDKVGASVDLIKNGVNGYVVNGKNAEQLYEAMKKILLEPDARDQMGKTSKEIIESGFTINDAANGFIEAVDYAMNRYR